MKGKLVTVVEALNKTLKERYVGSTMLLADELGRRVERRQPPVPPHWMPGHDVVFKCLEYAIQHSRLGAYIAKHRRDNPLPGWKELGE